MELAFTHDNIPLEVHHNRKAKRYLLRIRPDGSLRVTVPRHGNQAEALRFVARQKDWISRHRPKVLASRQAPPPVTHGSLIWYRGEKVPVAVESADGLTTIRFADQHFPSRDVHEDWKPCIEEHLRRTAENEFPFLVSSLASRQGQDVKRVSVRDQKSRWGSCSGRKTVSLNWRLIQVPAFVLEYVIVHELMHLQHMNHSAKFWQAVATAFPDYLAAERWLKQHGRELR